MLYIWCLNIVIISYICANLPVGHRIDISAHDWHQQTQQGSLSARSEKLSFRVISYGSIGSIWENFLDSSPGELVAVDKHDGDAIPLAEEFPSWWSLASLLWLRDTESFTFSSNLEAKFGLLVGQQDRQHLPHNPFRTGFWVQPLVEIVRSFVPNNQVEDWPPFNIKSAVGCLKVLFHNFRTILRNELLKCILNLPFGYSRTSSKSVSR